MKTRRDDTEAELLARARQGDEKAFGLLCARYESRLRARIERRLSPGVRRKISARDVLQEAHLVAHQQLADFENRGDEAFGRWLGRIVELKTREAVRRYAGTAKRAADREVTEGRLDGAGAARGREPTPSQVVIANELKVNAAEAMQRLPEHYRMVLHLVQGEGLTLAEAAERMARSRDSVKGLYARALAQLAAELGLDRDER